MMRSFTAITFMMNLWLTMAMPQIRPEELKYCADLSNFEDPLSKSVARAVCDSEKEALYLDAVADDDVPVVLELLKSGVSIETDTERGQTGISIAAASNFRELTQILINAGADVDAQDKSGKNALVYATQYGYDKIVRMLLDANADPNVEYQRGKTALTHAINRGDEKVVRWLLESGANVNMQDSLGFTPLMKAIRYQKSTTPIIKMILDAGADTTVRTNEGLNALNYAYQLIMNRFEAIELLDPRFNEINKDN